MFLLLAREPSEAQPLPAECMQSIPVKPNATMIHWGWLPGADAFASPLSCTRAELLRERLFASGTADGFGAATLETARHDPDPKATVLASFEQLRGMLQGKPSSQLRLALDVQLLAFSKNTLIFCFTTARGWGKVACGLSVIPFVVQGYDLIAGMGAGGGTVIDQQKALALISQGEAALDDAPAKPAPASSPDALARLNEAQLGLCREILQSCKAP